ncbi:MAG: hypothetical protein RLZZ324_486 [Candidatus Parcubacteria bacterium]
MDVSVIIVSWKVRSLLERCLRSVYSQTKGMSFEVIVTDNDSRDGSVEMVSTAFPEATLIASNRNLGFAAGCNAAIAQSRGEFVLLLNPDCELREDAVSKMVSWMRAHPDVAILGPRLQNEDGSTQESVARFPRLLDQALVMLKLHNVAPWLPSLKRYFARDFDYARDAAVDQVKGAAFMIRRSAMEKIGLLDERFFIWYEEVDWCKRAHDSGLPVWYTASARVTHGGGASFGQVFGPARQRMLNKSMRQYMRKHHGMLPYLALLALHPLSMLLAYIAAPMKNKRYVATIK